jgi:hypothetical protein
MADGAFPPSPETVRCPKCLRDVVIASTPGRTMASDCAILDCPITNDPNNQVGELWGTSISFTEASEISQEGRIERFATWEKLGLERVKADLLNGGYRLVGGTPAIQALAWEWVRSRENVTVQISPAKPAEMLTLKPGIWGINVDLKVLGRRVSAWWRRAKS